MSMLRIVSLAVALWAGAMFAGPASAQSDPKAIVDAAKGRCEIGETVRGYLEVVDGKSPDAAVVAAMNEINIKRRALFARLASSQSVGLDVVAQITGEKQVRDAPAGTCVKDSTGAWKEV